MMTDLHPLAVLLHEWASGRTGLPFAATETRPTLTKSGRRAAPPVEFGAGPVAVQLRIGERWIAGQALCYRTDATGSSEVLVSHHGHLLWVDEHDICF